MTKSLKAKAAAIFLAIKSRDQLEAEHGQVWNEVELEQDFVGCLHMGPLALVIRREDGLSGTIAVQDRPRFYHSFVSF